VLDLAIHRGRVVDGSGEPPFQADVGVRDGRIVAVGTLYDPLRARSTPPA